MATGVFAKVLPAPYGNSIRVSNSIFIKTEKLGKPEIFQNRKPVFQFLCFFCQEHL
jgi:hypothetical protein